MTDTETNTPGDSPITPDEMIAAWRQLIADGHSVEWKPAQFPTVYIYERGRMISTSYAEDADPLRAFEQAYRKWQEGTGR